MSSDSESSRCSHHYNKHHVKKIDHSVKITKDLVVKHWTKACHLSTQCIAACDESLPISVNADLQVNGSLNVSGPITFPESGKICTLITQNVSPCTEDTVFFESKVASSITNPTLGQVGVFKADDITSPNMSVVIEPKGAGALLASESGDSRGANAVDLQTNRQLTTQVASGGQSVISGGKNNTASGQFSAVSSGANNTTSGQFSAVSSGANNTASGIVSVVSGGLSNTASGDQSVVSGGISNTASGNQSVVSSGIINTASGQFSVVSGGFNNTTSGFISVVSGGASNTASGERSFAAGTHAQSLHDQTFVWGGTSVFNSTTSSASNQAIFNLENANYTPPAASSTFYVNGDFVATGTITGFAKSFEIPHPVLTDKRLRFFSIEGPSVDLIYRGKAKLTDGKATVNIDVSTGMAPGTFVSLNHNVQLFLNNNKNWEQIRILDPDTLATGEFCIISNNPDSTICVDWLVVGQRVGVDPTIELDVPPPANENTNDQLVSPNVDSLDRPAPDRVNRDMTDQLIATQTKIDRLLQTSMQFKQIDEETINVQILKMQNSLQTLIDRIHISLNPLISTETQ